MPQRIEAWLLILSCGLVVDELIKEGYVFKIEDIINLSFTHEKIIVTCLAISAIAFVWRKRK